MIDLVEGLIMLGVKSVSAAIQYGTASAEKRKALVDGVVAQAASLQAAHSAEEAAIAANNAEANLAAKNTPPEGA